MHFPLSNGYVFDSDRLILIPEKVSEDNETIENIFPNTDPFAADKTMLLHAKTCQTSMENRIIRSAGIILTYKCSLLCTYCSQSSVEESRFSLTTDDILIFIRDVLKKRILTSIALKTDPSIEIHFTGGGEPTYEWDKLKQTVTAIIKECEKHGIICKLGITTNGLLSKEQCFYIANHFHKVMISYDGLPEIQNKNRRANNGKTINEQVVESIRIFSNSKIITTVRTTLWQEDIPRLLEMYRYISNCFPNIDAWDINPVAYEGRALLRTNVEAIYSSESFVETFYSLKEMAKKDQITFAITSPIMEASSTGFSCGGTSFKLVSEWLLPDRRIITCCDSTQIVTQIGDICDGKVRYFDKFEDPLLDQAISRIDNCHKCFAYRICGGGCPLKHCREQQNHTHTLEWECNTIRSLWQYIIDKAIIEGTFEDWAVIDPPHQKAKELGIKALIEI